MRAARTLPEEQPRTNHKWTDQEMEQVLSHPLTNDWAAVEAQNLNCKFDAIKAVYGKALSILNGALDREREPWLLDDPYIQRIERALKKLGWVKALRIFPYKGISPEELYDRQNPESKNVPAKHKRDWLRKIASEAHIRIVKESAALLGRDRRLKPEPCKNSRRQN